MWVGLFVCTGVSTIWLQNIKFGIKTNNTCTSGFYYKLLILRVEFGGLFDTEGLLRVPWRPHIWFDMSWA